MALNLRIPGPTPCPQEVLEASARPMIDHRGPEFREILLRVTSKLQELYQTKNDLFILTASGTGAMEAAVVNTLSPGDKVLASTIGEFGDRFIQIAKTYGAQVEVLRTPLGKALDPDTLRKALQAHPDVKAVLITHNETSTGVTNPLEGLAKVVREFDKLLLVDAISSIGSIPCRVDAWGLDVVTSGSQKGWMAPPGLSMVSMSARAWQAQAQAKTPRVYFDLAAAKRYLERGQTPWTPAVSVFYAMDVALDRIRKEGQENLFRRQARLAQMCRDGVKELGLSLFPDEAVASNTVTAVAVPEGVDVARLRQLLAKEHQVVVAGGQGSLAGKLFRIGHLGYCTEEDIRGCLAALKATLPRAGFQAVGAARRSG